MRLDLASVKKQLDSHGVVRSVEQVERGHVRIETGFLYPDGSAVDLFLPAPVQEPLLPDGLRLSDLGHTMQWLLDVQVRPWLSRKRQRFVEDALRLYGARQNGGALDLRLASLDELPDGVVRLGQACVRVSDLLYTRRSALQSPFSEEVEEVLADGELAYEPNVELQGRFGATVRLDFLVRGRRTQSGVLTWSSANGSQAHVQANEIFRRWYDLDIPTRTEQRVTVLDDRYDIYREDDMRRLRDKSDVVALSDRTTLLDLLAA